MNMRKTNPKHLAISFSDRTADELPLTEFVKGTDEARAVPRPSSVGKFNIETEYEHAANEQVLAYENKGEEEARPARIIAEALEHEAVKATAASEAAERQSAEARDRQKRAHDGLGPHVRRSTNAKLVYWLRWGTIGLGDVAGIAGAALMLGEEPILATFQASSAAVSALTLGAVGREVRYMKEARRRSRDLADLAEPEREFASFFTGPASEAIIKILLLACAAGAVLIAGGILALRSATEGSTAGLVFGALALALGLASFYNSYDAADDVAELLDNKDKDVKKAEKKARKAASAKVIKQAAAAKAEAESIRTANEKAGEAAAAGIRRLLYAALGNSAGVVGHGEPPESAPAITTVVPAEAPEIQLNGSHPNKAELS